MEGPGASGLGLGSELWPGESCTSGRDRPASTEKKQVNKNACRPTYIHILKNKHDLLESHRQTKHTLLYIMPLHRGINII